jgi:hypothetical protein
VAFTIIEGLLAGSSFLSIYLVIDMLLSGNMAMSPARGTCIPGKGHNLISSKNKGRKKLREI